MRSLLSRIVILFCVLFCVGSSAPAVTIDTVPIGNPGNAADGVFVWGAVNYEYRIGTYEVTNAQYVEFLNAKAARDPLGLYNTDMGDVPMHRGGITRSGADGSYTYATIAGRGDKPVNSVSWYDAIRFANWLHNGQGSADTEMGAYTLLGGTPTPSNGETITQNVGARWFLPSRDEWYKAAYYDAASSSYFDYPTATDTTPTAEAPPGAGNSENSAFVINDVTDVGAYTGSDSPYGTFDQGGNVFEWPEPNNSHFPLIFQGGSFGPGGSLAGLFIDLEAKDRAVEHPWFGFRLATIPEPSIVTLAAIGFIGLTFLGWRRRKR